VKKSKAKAKRRDSNPTIGLLIAATDTDEVWHSYITAFKNAVGTTPVSYDPQPPGGAGGDPQKYAKAAKQLVSDNVNVIVTAGELAAAACKKATKTIPIVVASAGDLAAVAAPNLTGFTNGQVDPQILDARIIRMLKKLLPQKAVAVVGNDTVPPVKTAMDYAVASLQQKRVPVYSASFTTASDFKDEATIQEKLKPAYGTTADVLLVCSDPLMRTHGSIFVNAAHHMHMKTMHEFAEWHTKHGGDLCYGLDFTKLFQRAAGYVDQILARGARAPKLPVIAARPKDCVLTP
jgi:putative tryptophan/tyrosine transport system substrate-binding protein